MLENQSKFLQIPACQFIDKPGMTLVIPYAGALQPNLRNLAKTLIKPMVLEPKGDFTSTPVPPRALRRETPWGPEIIEIP